MSTQRQMNSIIKEIIKPVPKNKRYYPYLERQDIEDRSSWYINRLHRYSLKGLISPQYFISDIYLLFFKSFYNTAGNRLLATAENVDSRMRIKQNHISYFYKQFIRLIYLQSLLGQEGRRTDHAASLLDDLVSPKQRDLELKSITKGLISNYFQQYKSQWQKHSQKNYRQYEETKKLRLEISQVLSRIYAYAEEKCEQILQIEVLPSPLFPRNLDPASISNKDNLIIYLKNAFKKISSIYVLFKGKKKNMLQNLQVTLGRYMTAKLHIQTEGENKQSKYFLTFSRPSIETEPVLTKLYNYMTIRRVSNKRNTSSLRQINLVLIKDVLAACRKYYRFVKKVYPLISVQDIVIDQKSLKPLLGHTSLIYDALGIQGKDVSSMQLQIAMNSTPKPIDFEKCHLQLQSDGEWALIRKYFTENRQKKENQEEVKKNAQEFVQQDSDEQAEQQRLEGCPMKSKQIQEKVHVWRLICIFFQIMKEGKHLIHQFYTNKYSKMAKDGIPPFKKDLYQKAIKQLYHIVLKNPQKITEYLGLTTQVNEDYQNKPFQFKLRELEKIFNMQEVDDDSLLERHRFEQSKTELWMRSVLRKEIFQIILKDKYFKRILNVKKYMFMFTVSCMEISYETIYPIWQAERKPGARKMLVNQLNDQHQFKKLSFFKEKERKRSNLESFSKRLNEYMLRNDQQNRFLQSNPLYKKNIKAVYDNCVFLLKSQRLFMDYEQNSNINREENSSQSYQKSITIAKNKSIETFNLASQMLKQLIEKTFENKLERPEDFHKIDTRLVKEFYIYLTKKLYYLLKAFHTVSHQNFRKYQTFILPFLLQPKSLGVQNISTKLQEIKQPQLFELNAKLDQIGEILREETGQNIGQRC